MNASDIAYLILSVCFLVSCVLSMIYLMPQFYKWKKEKMIKSLEKWQIDNLRTAIDKQNISEDRQIINYIETKIIEK